MRRMGMFLTMLGRRLIAPILVWTLVLPSGLAPAAITAKPNIRIEPFAQPVNAYLPSAGSAPAARTRSASVLRKLLTIGTPSQSGAPPPVISPCSSPANAIVAENCQPGNPSSEWDLPNKDAGDLTIQGFTTDFSVNKGQSVQFKVKTDATHYRLDIYRMGYYGGMGARKVATVLPHVTLPQTQPACLTDPTTGLIDCGNWAISATWQTPADAVSGIYFAKAVRVTDSGDGGASHIFFLVRDDSGHSDLLFQTADTTWQAYNDYGGNSLYSGNPVGRAYKVSYNRPFTTRGSSRGAKLSWVFSAEYPMVRWLEASGYSVSYTSGMDMERRYDTDVRRAELLTHKVFLSVGHNEYWSGLQRSSVEWARDRGLHLAFFSGNDVFWRTRWEPSIDGSGTPSRTLVSYKETHAGAKIDPSPEWTGTWRDPRFSPPSNGGRPENALTGTIFTVNGERQDGIRVPATFRHHRFWRHTSIAALQPEQSALLPPGTLGYEWNEDLDNGFRPAGLQRLSSTTLDVTPLYLLDYGSNYGHGTATHSLTQYRAAGGALVFSAGTVQWSWGLDAVHDNANNQPPSLEMRQATVNLFTDMGVLPKSPSSSLVVEDEGSMSLDRTAPFSTITSPPSGATMQNADPLVIEGTATDLGGGIVSAVEVSTDGGETWRSAASTWVPAQGRANWTFSWVPNGQGTVRIQSRAIDDSGNMQAPAASVDINVLCPCSIWNDRTIPTVTADPDTSAVELGVRFRADVDGFVTGVRFYKGAANVGTHVGSLWTASGSQRLASATFTNETSQGWQQVLFDTPVAIAGGVTYVASYFAPNGRFARDRPGLSQAVITPPLTAAADGEGGAGNGVFKLGAGFPNQSLGATNYWVDVVFTTTASTSAAPGICPCTIWPVATTPTVIDNADGQAAVEGIELGVRFRADRSGFISGIRFYKSVNNTGAHTGTLWNDAGGRLATGQFVGESASGWQELRFDNAVAIVPNTTYVASYHTNVGRYSIDRNYFVSGLSPSFTRSPMRALVDGEDGPNGVYRYGPHGFPIFSYAQSNYWVDVVFAESSQANTAPSAAEDAVITPEDTARTVASPGVLGNDTDADGNTLTAILVGGTGNGVLALNANGGYTYTPTQDFHGTDTFTYKANDGLADSSVATVTITVTSINDAPSFTKGVDQTVLEEAAAQSIPGWATGLSAGPADEAAQLLNFIVGNNNTALFSAQPAVAANGTLTYTPAANANGSATVTVQLHDNGGTLNGGVDTSVHTFTIGVTAVNDVPSFNKGADQTVLEDAGARSIAGWATGLSAGPVNESGQTLSFMVSNTNTALFSRPPAVDANGALTYTPAANANGSAIVTVQMKDNGGTANGGMDTSAPQTFTINVTAVNDAPVPTADSKNTTQSVPLTFAKSDLSANDSAGPTNESGQTLNVTAVKATASTNGTVVFDAVTHTVTYMPAPLYTGPASFEYTVCDNGPTGGVHVNCATGMVNVTVAALVNGALIANNDAAPINEDVAVNVAVLSNDTDPDGDTLSLRTPR
jgi:VCBS repeat-containing protein